jgi:hypothetical protein
VEVRYIPGFAEGQVTAAFSKMGKSRKMTIDEAMPCNITVAARNGFHNVI